MFSLGRIILSSVVLVSLVTSLPTDDAVFQSFRSIDARRLLPRQGNDTNTSTGQCRMNYTTDVWTGCADVLSQFKINMNDFHFANPDVGSACQGFVPGKTYCVSVGGSPFKIPLSKKGLCGAQQNWTNTCVGSDFGNCCGSGGYCGSDEEYCGVGNCQEGSCDGGKPYSTNGRCGKNFNYLECPPKFGLCCSEYGHCGNSSEACGTGCQNGPCSASTLKSSSTSTSTTSKPTASPFSISPDGTCGYKKKYVCKDSKFGNCCSAAGYCSSDMYHCSALLGCQSQYGTCNGTELLSSSASVVSRSMGTSMSSSTTSTTGNAAAGHE